MIRGANVVIAVIPLTSAASHLAPAQQPPAILEIDSVNLVAHFYDVTAATDPSKIGTNPNISPAVTRSFDRIAGLADIAG